MLLFFYEEKYQNGIVCCPYIASLTVHNTENSNLIREQMKTQIQEQSTENHSCGTHLFQILCQAFCYLSRQLGQPELHLQTQNRSLQFFQQSTNKVMQFVIPHRSTSSYCLKLNTQNKPLMEITITRAMVPTQE
jgi:hypothetical protein